VNVNVNQIVPSFFECLDREIRHADRGPLVEMKNLIMTIKKRGTSDNIFGLTGVDK